MPITIGSCLVYAVYYSPLSFIRTLLEIGADPNAPVDDGFPPLIAAVSCTRAERGANRRTDVDEMSRLLLSFGADPNQRGINDYTRSTWRSRTKPARHSAIARSRRGSRSADAN